MKQKIGSFSVEEGKHSFRVDPIEDYLHLQAVVKMELRGRRVGAYLLRKSPHHGFSVVFGFDCVGIHSGLTPKEVEAALERLASGLNDFPPGESLTVHLSAVKNDRDRQGHLASLVSRAPSPELKFLLTGERQRVQELSRLGLREPKHLRLFVTYRAAAGDLSHADWVDRTLLRVESFLSSLGGSKDPKFVHLSSFLRQAFSSGYIQWEQVLGTKFGLRVRALNEEEMWADLWGRLNLKSPVIPIPQLLTLGEDSLTEQITSDVHATTLLCADHVPVADRRWVRARGQFHAVLTFWDKPGGWKDGVSQL